MERNGKKMERLIWLSDIRDEYILDAAAWKPQKQEIRKWERQLAHSSMQQADQEKKDQTPKKLLFLLGTAAAAAALFGIGIFTLRPNGNGPLKDPVYLGQTTEETGEPETKEQESEASRTEHESGSKPDETENGTAIRVTADIGEKGSREETVAYQESGPSMAETVDSNGSDTPGSANDPTASASQPGNTTEPAGLSETPTMTISNTAVGFQVTVTAAEADTAMNDVLIESWTESNGQDDLVQDRLAGNGTIAISYVDASDHQYQLGKYIVRCTYTNQSGKKRVTEQWFFLETAAFHGDDLNPNGDDSTQTSGSAESETPSLSIINTVLGLQVTLNASVADTAMNNVLFEVWTETDGQDDLVQDRPVPEGLKAVSYVDVSDHQYLGGVYIIRCSYTNQSGQVRTVEQKTIIDTGSIAIHGEEIEPQGD